MSPKQETPQGTGEEPEAAVETVVTQLVSRTTSPDFAECLKCGETWPWSADHEYDPDVCDHDVVHRAAKPSVGRVVLVNVGMFGGEPVLRPAIVVAADVSGYPDAATVAIFTAATDFPLPPGLNIRQPEVGSPAYPAKAPWQIEVCRYGTAPGQWSWPIRCDETFDVVE